MRLLGILAIVAPVMLGILLLYDPNVTASWVVEGYREIGRRDHGDHARRGVDRRPLVAHDAHPFRPPGQGRREDRRRRLHGRGPRPAAAPSRPAWRNAINGISTSLADTHDRATIDRLTGVANRQALLAYLFAEVERATRYERPLCVAFVDIDHFKVVNDSYGHDAGDLVLRDVAQTLAENLRASDLIGRYGGEEFMLILTETDVEEGGDAEREAARRSSSASASASRATQTCR